MRRLINALMGFFGGVMTSPLAVIVWPVVLAWFMWKETDEKEGEE